MGRICFLNRKSGTAWRSLAGALCVMASAAVTACTPHLRIEEVPPAQIETTLFLIGDAGEPNPRQGEAALDSLTVHASAAPGRSIILFLGDNVYPDGIPEEGRAEYADARRRLEVQVNAVPMGARAIFVPGNHDWAGTEAFGLYSVRLQEQMLKTLAGGRDVRMMPGNGCPGPAVLDAGRLRLIAMDTQWWLHNYIVRDAQSTNCIAGTGNVTAALRDQVKSTPPGRVTIVAGHHPLMTGGEHGGYCGVSGPFRRLGGSSQDIMSGANRTMRDSLESAFRAQPPLAYAAGHEHNLQVIKGGTNVVRYILVSGAGAESKASCAVRLRESYYVSQHRSGFMRVDIMKGKGVLLRVYHFPSRRKHGLSFTRWLEDA